MGFTRIFNGTYLYFLLSLWDVKMKALIKEILELLQFDLNLCPIESIKPLFSHGQHKWTQGKT